MLHRFVLVAVFVATVPGCGASSGPVRPGPTVEWTPSLELATASLNDPHVSEALTELPDDPASAAARTLVSEAYDLAQQRDAAGSAERVAEARDALAGRAGWEDSVLPAVLELVLADVEERFRQALAAAST